MVILQGAQGQTSLTQPFIFLTYSYSAAKDWAPECPYDKNWKGGLDQYGRERFSVDSFLPQSEKVWDW